MTRRNLWAFVGAPAGLALAAALGLASAVTSGENAATTVRPAVMAADELLRVFQESKDDAEQAAPPEISLSPAFDPQPAAVDFR
jgi:hypothetical protein